MLTYILTYLLTYLHTGIVFWGKASGMASFAFPAKADTRLSTEDKYGSLRFRILLLREQPAQSVAKLRFSCLSTI